MKSYTVEELKKLKEEWTQDKQTKTYDFLDWLSDKEKADDLHPIVRVIIDETGMNDWSVKWISDTCKKLDLRLWPEVTEEMVNNIIDGRFTLDWRVDKIKYMLNHLRDTFAVPAARKE
jgi:hypothetical protein